MLLKEFNWTFEKFLKLVPGTDYELTTLAAVEETGS